MARVEQRQRGAVAADLHHVLNQTLDRLLFVQFSLKAFAKRFNYGLGQRLSCSLGQGARQPISIRILNTKGHLPPRFPIIYLGR